jgi:hypothetical protein
MSKLKTERNTSAMAERVICAFASLHDDHPEAEAVFEHGQWWVQCPGCGAQWAAQDAEGPPSTVADGFTFEEVSHGDESCFDLEDAEEFR